MRYLAWVSIVGSLLLPLEVRAGCGSYCPLPRATQIIREVVPVVTTFELLVPAVAVSFQYLPPPSSSPSPYQSPVGPGQSMGAAPANPQPAAPSLYAAESYDGDEQPTYPVSLTVAAGSRALSVFRNRCYSCHGTQAQGGVKLWDAGGQFAPTKGGQVLSKGKIYRVTVLERRMPKGATLTNDEIAALNEWIGE